MTAHKAHGLAEGAVKWTIGKQGGACEFPEKGAFIQGTNQPALAVTQATYSVWFKLADTGMIGRVILGKGRPRRGLGHRGRPRDAPGAGACSSRRGGKRA
jgi:hypothetical protein